MKKIAKWWTETARPWINNIALPGLLGVYQRHEVARHVVTFGAGVFIGWAL